MEKSTSLAIQEEIKAFSATVAAFCNKKMGELKAKKEQHNQAVREGNERMSQLQDEYEQLKAKEKEQGKLAKAEKEKMEGLQRQITELEARAAELPEKLAELSKQKEAVEAERVVVQHAAHSLKQDKRYKSQELTNGLLYFKKRLGLDFQVARGAICVRMTLIDWTEPQREFTFQFSVDENNTYNVTHCVPQVGDLAQIVAVLNESNDITTFIISMRRSFKALCNPKLRKQAQPAAVDSEEKDSASQPVPAASNKNVALRRSPRRHTPGKASASTFKSPR